MRKVAAWRLKEAQEAGEQWKSLLGSGRKGHTGLNISFKEKANSQRNNDLKIIGKVEMNQWEERR